MREGEHWEPLSPDCRVLVSRAHRFTTDTILLAHFAAPKKWERCADLGTGCGTIPLLWHARYAPRAVTGVELDADALRQAQASVEENGLEGSVTIRSGDIRSIRAVCRRRCPPLSPAPRRTRRSAPACAMRMRAGKTRGTSAPVRLGTSRGPQRRCCASAAGCASASGPSG